jgi:hypothetical protein
MDTTNEHESAFAVFGRVLYVMLDMIKQSSVNSVIFTAHSSRLDSVYTSLTSNKPMNSTLNNLGYSNLHKTNNVFITTKLKGNS